MVRSPKTLVLLGLAAIALAGCSHKQAGPIRLAPTRMTSIGVNS